MGAKKNGPAAMPANAAEFWAVLAIEIECVMDAHIPRKTLATSSYDTTSPDPRGSAVPTEAQLRRRRKQDITRRE